MTKPCIYCSKEIELVHTAQGWRPFNPHDLTPHDCPEGIAARAAKKAASGGGYQPKDERMIAKEICLKEAAEVYRILYTGDPNLPIYEDACEEIVRGFRILRDAILEDEKVPQKEVKEQ